MQILLIQSVFFFLNSLQDSGVLSRLKDKGREALPCHAIQWCIGWEYEFRIFFLDQGKKARFILLLTHRWKEREEMDSCLSKKHYQKWSTNNYGWNFNL